MSILLLSPYRAISKGNIWKEIDPVFPPLGLAYIASYLEEKRQKVNILDLKAEPMDVSQFKSYIKELNPHFIGISATTAEIESALSIAKLSKDVLPQTKIILGGVHPSIMPDEVLLNPQIDFVVRGEGEYTLHELVSNFDNLSDIVGISYRQNGVIRHNPDRPFIEDLDEMPMPAYHLLPMNKYRPTLGNYKRLPAVHMITTRGCPGRCTFCYTGVTGNKIRKRLAKNILEEIKLLQKNYKIKEISFYDDTFTAFRENVLEFCESIIKENMDITWSCMSRIDCVDEEILRLMKKSGCHQIGYGLESANKEILKNIRKNISIDLAEGIIRLTQKCGIDVRAMFMLGNPGETEETLRQTINLAIKFNPDTAIFNITTPWPGTDMYNWAKKNNYLLDAGWSKFDLATAVMHLPTISPEKIRDYYYLAYKKFYLRPYYISRRLSKLRTFIDIINNVKALFSILVFKKE